MNARLAVVLVVAAGCGRFGFDLGDDTAPGDASVGDGVSDTSDGTVPDGGNLGVCATPVGHDEDSDGVDDACDLCPQLAGDQIDTDGDHVGDQCDLAPTIEQRLLFDPAMEKHADWRYDANQTLNGDSITMPGTSGASVIKLPGTPAHTIVESGGRITAIGSGTHQIAWHIGREPTNNYYCELYEASGSMNVKLTLYNGSFNSFASTPVPGGFTVGSTFRLLFVHTPPSLRCIVYWNGTRYDAVGTDPGGVPLESMYMAANGANAEIKYFVRLATP